MPGMAPTILIPQTQLPRGLACLSCGAKFRHDQRELWERHAIRCSAQHEDAERDMSLRTSMGVFGGEAVIPDLEAWVARNRVELIEKRKKL